MKTTMAPVAMPSRLSGKVISRKVRHRLAPSSSAASSKRLSMPFSTAAIEITMNGTSTWTRPMMTAEGSWRSRRGRPIRPSDIRVLLSTPLRARITFQPNVRMMIEVSSGATRRKIITPFQRPAWRTMK